MVGGEVASGVAARCHAIAMRIAILGCYCHAIAMRLTCYCYMIAMLLPCHCHAIAPGNIDANRAGDIDASSLGNDTEHRCRQH